jgi:hypothetical protein
MEKGEQFIMSVSTATRPLYGHIQFGQPRIDAVVETFTMPVDDFEVLGTKVLTHLGERKQDFTYTSQLFKLYCTGLMELGVHLILEELSILVDEMSTDSKAVDQLKQIYNVLKLQAYAEHRVIAQLVE